MKRKSNGAKIDSIASSILQVKSTADARLKKLVKAGCLDAKIHFKSKRAGGEKNIMFLLGPTIDGERDYKHVGVDPHKQADCFEKVERERLRCFIDGTNLKLVNRFEKLECDLACLLDQYKDLLEESEIFATDYLAEG